MILQTAGRPAEILLVEDNLADVKLTRAGFKLAKLTVNLHHAEHGEACMAFLRREGKYAEAPRPDLILLDLNMPVMDGREVLAALLEDEDLRCIPVVVLTTSAADRDVLASYALKCSGFATKPVDFNEFVRVIQGISAFYFTVVVLPPQARNA